MLDTSVSHERGAELAEALTVADEPAAVTEMSGTIKWFDIAVGYGFIVPDGVDKDVLVHSTCLGRSGFQAAPKGARVVFEAYTKQDGRMHATRVISMDGSSAVPPVPRAYPQVVPTSEFERATCKWFNRLRGFGFLTRGEGTPDIFVHMETLRACGIVEMRPGQKFLVRHGQGPKGLMAGDVRQDLPILR